MDEAALQRARIRLRMSLRLLGLGVAVAGVGAALFRPTGELGGLLVLAGVALLHTALILGLSVVGFRALPGRARALAVGASLALVAFWWVFVASLVNALRNFT